MTDLLERDPNDTGDIPTGVGEATQRINAMIATAPFPTLRRPDAARGEVPLYLPETIAVVDGPTGGCRRVELDDDDLIPPGQPEPPSPLPAPQPQPEPKSVNEILWDRIAAMGDYQAKRSVLYVRPVDAPRGPGRHRAPTNYRARVVVLAAAVVALVVATGVLG